MTFKSVIQALSGAAAGAALLTGVAAAETWDMPLAYPASNFHSENAAAFGKCVTDATKGAVTIVTHPNGALFKGNDIKRAVQTGQAPIGERLLSAHANENVLFGVDSIPFLATSFDDAEKLWTAAEPKVAALLDSQNLVYLYSVAWPPQGLYTKKPIASAADLKGVKFRAYNAATARIAELAGMQPVQIEAAELSQALATGVVDSFISSGATGYDSKVWEQLGYFYEVDAWLPRNTVFANKDAFEGLSETDRKAVEDCAAEAATRGLQMAKDYTGRTLKGLSDNGMKVEKPADALASDLKGYGEVMTGEWLKQAGDDGKAIIDAYRGK
ncbi:TRAP transporter substrate-binding protein [Propylenella binzhouense]|uniref:TRAP transporter substrate-binding protein n=1 Tax=Propylenella binzhouense TaxID=2555902 RepID=UPI0031B650D1